MWGLCRYVGKSVGPRLFSFRGLRLLAVVSVRLKRPVIVPLVKEGLRWTSLVPPSVIESCRYRTFFATIKTFPLFECRCQFVVLHAMYIHKSLQDLGFVLSELELDSVLPGGSLTLKRERDLVIQNVISSGATQSLSYCSANMARKAGVRGRGRDSKGINGEACGVK